ncbi:MAG: GNAT family protein [Chloroflexi bacterium]|nr:GNAT family protein [Chloroflexota bacterium]MCY3582248.1 GNAT family protein [Chloroflexota bacterium]MCY3715012.1 GNAT family protein [Chloroflexota bacterium]MDE2650538.1 GNAT family protein [Chloroflexota bacterium]
MAAFDFSEIPNLETARLRLRRISRADCDDWLAVFQSPGASDWLTDFESSPRLATVASFVDWADEIFAAKTGIRWALTVKPGDRLVGTCGFHLYEQRHKVAEIGYELHSAYWRRGLMSEAVAAVLRFCFEQLSLHRLAADVTEGNAASAALLQKLGFSPEGILRERVLWRGGHHNLWLFSLLEPEYRRLVAAGRLA